MPDPGTKITTEIDRITVVDDREYVVREIRWNDTPRASFDVYANGQLLTEEESLDNFPTEDDIRALLPLSVADPNRVIKVTAGELVDEINDADEALDGDSNDAEHDALYALRERLSEWLEAEDR